jgi:negative regulator of flagellin synthesis FlgM
MKIGPLESKPAVTAPAERKNGAAPAAGTQAAEASAQVELSNAANVLSEASSDPTFDSAKVERIPTFDSAKVERIAQAIRDGKFTVNAEAIADKLIINAEELLGRKFSS